MAWLQSSGWPLASGIAEFWASRVVYNDTTNTYDIDDVQPPDEFHVDVNNSVFTNAVAALSLEFAAAVAPLVNQTAPPTWTKIAANMQMDVDTKRLIHPEYDGYLNDTVKQADVILLGFPLGWKMSAELLKGDLDFYESHTTDGGPAMTWAMFCIGHLALGDYEKAASLFLRSYSNIQEPFKVWTETPSGGTVNFITGAGGFLQGVAFGYGGVRLSLDSLVINPPPPPPPSTSLTLRGLNYLGWEFDVRVSDSTLTITPTASTPSAPILVALDAQGHEHDLTVPLSLQRQKLTISRCS